MEAAYFHGCAAYLGVVDGKVVPAYHQRDADNVQ